MVRCPREVLHCVRKVTRMGLSPMAALQIATINTARHYRLRNLRATAPSYWADFIVFDNLKKFVVRQTYKKGILVAEEGPYLAPQFSVTGCGSAHTGCTRRQPRRAVPQQWPTAGTSSPCAIAPGRPCRAAGRIFVAVCFFQTQAFREFPWSALTLSRSSHRKPTPSNPAADAHVGVRPGGNGGCRRSRCGFKRKHSSHDVRSTRQ